jgi:hypothetical protein
VPRALRLVSALTAVLLLLAGIGACAGAPPSPSLGGLRPGMQRDDALRAAEALYRQAEGSSGRPVVWQQWDSFSVHTDRSTDDDLTIRIRPDGRVDFICFNPGLVDRVFNARGEEAAALAQRLARDLRLPAMTHGVDTNAPTPVHTWQSLSPQGWKIVIDQHKNLIYQDWRRANDSNY